MESLESLIFTDYIQEEEYEDGIEWEGKIRKVESLTKEFRLKKTRVCLDLISYLRVYF